MLTHPSRLRSNDTDREIAIHRTVRPFLGCGTSQRLAEEQVPGFAHRVRMYAHLSGQSAETVIEGIGLGGEAAAQVLAALEGE
jgi:hypothetical protein